MIPFTASALCSTVDGEENPFPLIGDAAYRQHAGGGPSHGHGQYEQKLVKIMRVVPEISCRTDRHTDKPVGFYGPIAPPVPNAPSSLICGHNLRNDADATFLDPHISVVHCSSSRAAPAASTDAARYDRWEVAGMANFKVYLLRQFCSNRVEIFLQYTGDTDAKK